MSFKRRSLRRIEAFALFFKVKREINVRDKI
jgi:hypothetical protein